MGFWLRFNLLVFTIAILSTPVLSDLILSKVDRRVSYFLLFYLSPVSTKNRVSLATLFAVKTELLHHFKL